MNDTALMYVEFSTTRNPTHHVKLTDVITMRMSAEWLDIETVDGLKIEIPADLLEDLSWKVQ
jgi:hypothetical protein